jgi:hypothetical protein
MNSLGKEDTKKADTFEQQNLEEKMCKMEIDFERPYHNDSLMTTDAFIQHGNFDFMQKKLIECVSSLLCKRSENMHDYKADNFITGDGYDAKRNMTFLMINEYDIAKEYGTYANKIRRDAILFKIPIRDNCTPSVYTS